MVSCKIIKNWLMYLGIRFEKEGELTGSDPFVKAHYQYIYSIVVAEHRLAIFYLFVVIVALNTYLYS